MNIDKRQFLGLFAAYAMTGFKIESILASMNLIYQNPILRIQYMDLMDWDEEKFERIFTNFNKNRESLVINNIENFMYKMYINNMDVTKRLEFFKKYLTPSQDEVKLFGEVFTPIPLIEEMLDKLPKDVWSNKDLKWLDPANGIGNFPIIIFLKLMVGLKDVIINEEDRKKHILENMLYMVDISPKNTFLCYNIFDPESKYKLNIHKGDFLTCDLQDIFGIEKFDIIVGNPPFNKGGINNMKGHNHEYYRNFVIISLTYLKSNGLLYFITPKGMLPRFHKDKIVKLKEILFIEIMNNIHWTYNTLYFLLKNTARTLDQIHITDSILNKVINGKNELGITSAGPGLEVGIFEKDDINKYKYVFNITKARGVEFSWFNKIHKAQLKPKVVISRLNQNYFIDYNGEYGNRHGLLSYVPFETGKECDNLIQLLNSKLSIYITEKLKSHQRPWDTLLKNYKKINLKYDVLTDNIIYKEFGLSTNEIQLIENVVQ